VLPIIVLGLTALSTVLIKRRKRAAAGAPIREAEREEVRTAAG